jgi:type IV pilus assembly protein PilM
MLHTGATNRDMSSKPTYFYTDKPLFGFDIGHGSVKVMQLEPGAQKSTIKGYGTANFDIKALDEGVIVDPETIAGSVRELFKHHLVGEITTKRAAMALPGYRTFTRSIQLPKLGEGELQEAVQLEVEQYAPLPLQDLYLDYAQVGQTAENTEFFVVAVPKKIVDSYLVLADMLGLDVILIEPTMAACARFFAQDKHSGDTTVILDFGSMTASISIFDKTILATSTVPAGGLVFTEAIRNKLQVDMEKAGQIKTRHGLDVSQYQKEVIEALAPVLEKLSVEIRRMLRYYEERYGNKKGINQVVMLGGGANMPGLSNYLTDLLKAPVRTFNHPWAVFEYSHLKPPSPPDRLMYATVAGLSLLKPQEVFLP